MRILFALSSMPVGGLEVFIAELAKKLASDANDIAVLVFKAKGEGIALLADSKIQLFPSQRKGRFDFLFLRNVYRSITDFNPDIILSLSAFTYFFIELIQRLSAKPRPHLVAFHSLKPYGLKDVLFTRIFLLLSKAWKAYYLFISNSQFNLNRTRYGLTRKKCFMVYNGVDTDFFKPIDKESKKQMLNIIHIANVRPEKDQWTLIKALKILNKDLSDWSLTFIGKDRDNELVKFGSYLHKENLADKVTFIHAAERKRIKDFLCSADIFILTSIMEVFPVSALEAMAMGLACILTDVGGCPEMVTDGYNGYLVKPRDPQAIAERLLFLYKNPDLLKRMGQNARKTVLEKFNLEVCVKRYKEVFDTVLENGQRC